MKVFLWKTSLGGIRKNFAQRTFPLLWYYKMFRVGMPGKYKLTKLSELSKPQKIRPMKITNPTVLVWVTSYWIDPHNLSIHCKLNGEIVQDSNTNQLFHKTEAMIAFISTITVPSSDHINTIWRFVTFKPGNVILTSTPPRVGCFRKPPLWVKVRIRITIMSQMAPPKWPPWTSMGAIEGLGPSVAWPIIWCSYWVYIVKGDVVECEVAEIGTIRNEIQ